MMNPFADRTPSVSGPARDILPVTPSDSVDFNSVAIGLYVEMGGAVSIETEAGITRTITVPSATILPVGVRRVNATGTTASGIHAFLVI
ncbi:MAG: hypothetical protein AAFP13_03765 [Pseudomonadota bacterium]